MKKRTAVHTIIHRDGEEYIFKCPDCDKELSCGSWVTSIICHNCKRKIKIITTSTYAELE